MARDREYAKKVMANPNGPSTEDQTIEEMQKSAIFTGVVSLNKESNGESFDSVVK